MPRSIFSSKMKTADKIRFAVRHARFCFSGLGSRAHTCNILDMFDLIKELLQDRVSVTHVRNVLHPKFVSIAVRREGLFPEVESTITIHQVLHTIQKLPDTGPLKQHWMFAFERLNHHIRGLVKNKAVPMASIVKNIRMAEASVQFFSINFHNLERYLEEHLSSNHVHSNPILKALNSFHVDPPDNPGGLPTIYLPETSRLIDIRGKTETLTITPEVQEGLLQYCLTNSEEGQQTIAFSLLPSRRQ